MFESLKAHIKKRIDLSDDDFNTFTSYIEVRHLKKKQCLVLQGENTRVQAYINKGCMRTYYTDPRAHEHVVQLGFEDWWTGDLMSFLTDQPATYTIEALEDCELYLIDKANLEKTYELFPQFERFFRILIQNAFIAQQQRLISTMSQSAEERYVALTKKYPQLEKRFAQHHIASYLGITPEALSRIRKALIEKMRTH